MAVPTTSQTEQQAEMKMLNRCNMHRDCRVDFDGWHCPMCELWKEIDSYRLTVKRLSGKVRDRDEDLERCRNRIFSLGIDVANLKDTVAELEGRLPEEDVEDDGPCEEPRRPEDRGARHGLDASAGLGGGGS